MKNTMSININEINAAMAELEAGNMSNFTEIKIEDLATVLAVPVVKKKKNRVIMTKLPSNKRTSVCSTVDFSNIKVIGAVKREVIDVTATIGKKIQNKKKVVNTSKIVEKTRGNTSKGFKTKMSSLFTPEIIETILSKKYKMIYINIPIDNKKLESLRVRLGRAIASLKRVVTVTKTVVIKKVTTPTLKKGYATNKRPVAMKRVVRLEIGHKNWGLFLGKAINRRVEVLLPVEKINIVKERISDFLNYGDPITAKGSKVKLTFCNDGIEIVGHAPKQIVMFDGKKSKYSFECEFISTLIGILQTLDYRVNKVGDKVTVTINEVEGMYQWVKDTAIELVKKTTNIIVSTVDRAMNVVAGDVKVNAQMCSDEIIHQCSWCKGYMVNGIITSVSQEVADEVDSHGICKCCVEKIFEVNLQACGADSIAYTTNAELIDKIDWTPFLYINGNVVIEATDDSVPRNLYNSCIYADDMHELHTKFEDINIDGVDYVTANLMEFNNATHYYLHSEDTFLVKRGNIVYVFLCNHISFQNKDVQKLVYSSNFEKHASNTAHLFMHEDEDDDLSFYTNMECIKALLEYTFGGYDINNCSWNNWTVYENAMKVVEASGMSNDDMIDLLKPLTFSHESELASYMLCCLTANTDYKTLVHNIFSLDMNDKGDVINMLLTYGTCILNSVVPINEVKSYDEWQIHLDIVEEEEEEVDCYNHYNCSKTDSYVREYKEKNMFYGFSDGHGTVIAHCTSDHNINNVDGEVCASLLTKGSTRTFKDSGVIFGATTDCIMAIFSKDVWSELYNDGKSRYLSGVRNIKEADICLNALDATKCKYAYNEIWVVPSKTKVAACFYKENCEESLKLNIMRIAEKLGVPCLELKDYKDYFYFEDSTAGGATCRAYNKMVTEYNWNLLSPFSFKSDHHSYDHMIEENKELEYVDKYEYIDMQMCARTDEIQGVGSYAAHLMVNNGMWADRIESEIHDPSYEECLSVIHCFDWTWGAGANEHNMPTMDSVYRALYQLDALKDMGAGEVANMYSDCVVDCCKDKYIPFTHIYNICINDVVVKEELNAYTEYLMKRHGYVANLSYVTEAILNGAPFSIIAEQAEENGVDVNKFFKWVTKQNINIVGYDMQSYFKEFKLHQSAFYFKKSLDLVDTSIEEIINLLKEVKLHNAQQANEQLNHMQYIESAKKFKVFEAFAYDNSLAETIQSVFNATFKTCNNDYLFNLNETVLAILSHIKGEISLDILHEMASERYSTCFDYYTDFRAVKHAFMAKHGRLPSHICDIVRVMHKYGVSQKCMVELATNYHVRSWKIFNDMINYDSDWSYQIDDDYKIWLHLVFGANIIDIAKKCIKVGKRKETNLMHTFAASIRATAVKYNELKQWYIKNVEANATLLNSIGGMWEVEGFPKYGKSSEMTEFIKKNEAMLEYWECVKQFPNLNWGNFPCEIPMTEVSGAKVLDPNDPVITYVGHLSHCCQTRGGAGQDCMLASMTHPKSSVLYITRDNKGYEEFLAQAWIWEASDSKTLVLDNIEFANNRPIESVFTQLINWLKASPYKMIQLGVGYCEEIAGKFPGVSSANMPGLTNYKGYSDATVSRVWLKKDNKLQGIFSEQNINLQMCASLATCNYSEITLDMETKTINSTIKTIQKIEKNAYPKNMRMMQGKYSKTDIVEYCECDSDQLRLFVGDNWYIILAVREYEVEVVDIASIGNMSRAMYSCMKDIIDDNDGLDFVFDARESTSFKFAEKLLSRYGYQTEESNVWNWDGENMHEIRMVKCIDVQMCASDDININMTVTPLPVIGSTNVINGYIGARKVLSFVNSTTVSHFSPKYTEMRGVIVGLEEAIRLGYKQCSFVGISKQTIKWFNGNCPAEESFIYKAMFEEKAEKIKIVFVNNGIDLQLFADNNTGPSVPETNGSEKEVQNNVQKETSSHKEGEVMNTSKNQQANNITDNNDCQTAIWQKDGVLYNVPEIVVLSSKVVGKEIVYSVHKTYSGKQSKQLLLNYLNNAVGDDNKKAIENAYISEILIPCEPMNYVDGLAKSISVKLVPVHENRVDCADDIVRNAIKEVSKDQWEPIFKTMLIINSESGLKKCIGVRIEDYCELMSNRIKIDKANRLVFVSDIKNTAKFCAREKSPRNCNEVKSIGRHGDTTAKCLIVPNSQQSGYSYIDSKFAKDFKLQAPKKFKFTGKDITFFTANGPVCGAEAVDNFKAKIDIFEGTRACHMDTIMICDGREFTNELKWTVAPSIKDINMDVRYKNGIEQIEYTVRLLLTGNTCITSGCKLRGVVSMDKVSLPGDITKFNNAIGFKSVVLVCHDVKVETANGNVNYDAIIPTEGVKFPTYILNNMEKNGGYEWVDAKIYNYTTKTFEWKKCLSGKINLGFESPTAEGRGSYKVVREKLVQAFAFVQATRSLSGLVSEEVINKIEKWYMSSIEKNLSEAIRLLKAIQGTTHVEHEATDIETIANMTDGEFISNEKKLKLTSIGGNTELINPIYIPDGKTVYKYFTYCPSDIENLGKDDIVAQMTKAEDPGSIREIKGGFRKLIKSIRDIATGRVMPTTIELEQARRAMLEDVNNAVDKYFSAEFDGGCFTVIYADWLQGDVCALPNTEKEYCCFGRQPYTNYWLNFNKVISMEEASKSCPFQIDTNASQNIMIAPMDKCNFSNGDSDGDYAIVKFCSSDIAKWWIDNCINTKLENYFIRQFADPSQRKLNGLLKEVSIEEFFTPKVYSHSFDDLAHYFAMACMSKNNTQTTTSLFYNMNLMLGNSIVDINKKRNSTGKYIAFNGPCAGLVQFAIDGIKADASTISIDSIRKLFMSVTNGTGGSLKQFNTFCSDYKISAVATEHQIETMTAIRKVLAANKLDAEKTYEAVRQINKITSGKLSYSAMMNVELNEESKYVCPEVYDIVKRYIDSIEELKPLMTHEEITRHAVEELRDTYGITTDMLKIGDREAVSDIERLDGPTYSWLKNHITHYVMANGHGHKSWNERGYIAHKYIMSEEFEKQYDSYNEYGEKYTSKLGRLTSFVLVENGNNATVNSAVSGKLLSILNEHKTYNLETNKKYNKRMTRIVIGLCLLAISHQKGSRPDGFYFVSGSNILADCHYYAGLATRAEKSFIKRMEEKNVVIQPTTKEITIEDALTLIGADMVVENFKLNLQAFASATKQHTIDKVNYKVWHKAIQPNSEKMTQILQAIGTLLTPYAHESVRVINRETLRLLEVNIDKCKSKNATEEDNNIASLLKEIWQIVKHAATRDIPRVTPVYIMEWYAKFRSTTHSVGKSTNVEQKSFRLIGVDKYTTWCLIVTDKNETYPVTMFLLNSKPEGYRKAKLTTYKLNGSDKLYYYGIIDKGLDTIDFSEEADRDAIISEIQNSGNKLSKL